MRPPRAPIDIIRALEAFLGKYPDTRQRALVEQTLAKSATDLNDNVRIVFYGEKVLSTLSPGEKDNVTLLDRVTRALLDSSDAEYARKKALEYVKRYEADLVALRKQNPPNHLTTGQWIEDLDRSQARVLTLEAQATGNLGDQAAAAKIAMKSWEAYPTGEGAREAALWLIKLGRDRQAVEFYADAFTLEDARTTAADRAKDRKRLGELYLKINGSEDGLGEVILKAYDRTSASLDERRAILKANDPNSVAANIEDFVLPAVADGVSSLAISSLQGKILVLDFWATWCVPCRAQQPLLEKVKKHFEDVKDIVFLPVNADDDPSLVAPFLKEQGWKDAGLFRSRYGPANLRSAPFPPSW